MELTTELDYRRVDPDIGKLRFAAIQMRPDIRSKRSSFSQREADLKLAKAYRFPDVTVGAGYSGAGASRSGQPADGPPQLRRAAAPVQPELRCDRPSRGGGAIRSGGLG
ncbi:MAG: TolC family protein [Nitrospiraceae bacterium]